MINITKVELIKFKEQFYRVTNYPIANYSDEIIETALLDNLIYLGLDNTADFISNIRNNLFLAEKFISSLSVPITQFMRNMGFMMRLKDKVLKDLLLHAALNNDSTINILVIGAATGEESYSIAILFEEARRELNFSPNINVVSIDSMDLNKDAVEFARMGIYTPVKLANMPKEWLSRYFDKFSQGYKIKDFIKKECKFMQIDVLEQFAPDCCYSLLFIRNVMIYWGEEAKNRFLKKMISHINTGAKIVVGVDEQIDSPTVASLRQVKFLEGVYEKI